MRKRQAAKNADKEALMHAWATTGNSRKGCSTASQAAYEGSIPFARSNISIVSTRLTARQLLRPLQADVVGRVTSGHATSAA